MNKPVLYCIVLYAGYVGYTRGHLHVRVNGHKRKSCSIYKHYHLQHNASSLTHIFNLFISTGIIPKFKDWKSARVTPIFKADSRVDPASYRPISALSVTAKLFEKAIFNQVYGYLNDNKLLSKFQSGFRPMHSSLTALIDITDNWYCNIDDGLTNAILFIY